MKKLATFHKTLLAITFFALSIGFTACSSDDDDNDVTPPEVNLLNMPGQYLGTATITKAEAKEDIEESTPGNIRLTITKDQFVFASFPIDSESVITMFPEDKETAEKLIKELESQDIQSELSFTADKTDLEKETVTFSITPTKEEKIISIETTMGEFNITIGTLGKGVYSAKEKTGTVEFTQNFKYEFLAKAEGKEEASTQKFEGEYSFSFEKINK